MICTLFCFLLCLTFCSKNVKQRCIYKNILLSMRKKSNSKPMMKKTVYEDLEEKDLQRLLDEKDQIIRKLEFKLEKLERQNQQLVKAGSGEGNMNNFYKEKLELEIQENDKAFSLFLTISDSMVKLIQMLKSAPEVKDDSSSVKGLLKMMGDINSSSSKSQAYSDESDEGENMEALQNQVSKRLEQLESICDIFHKNYMKLQKQSIDFEKRLKEIKKSHNDELKILNNQIKESRRQKESLKILLQKNEQQKNQILFRISNILDAKTRKQLQSLNRDGLVGYIKELMFKMSELQAEKTTAIKQNKKIKTQDLEKYKKILNQVKEFKQASRLGKSMM